MLLFFAYITQWSSYVYHKWFTFDRYRAHRCPSCGHTGRMGMKFNPVYAKLLLTCPRDGAVWGIDPVIPHGAWLVKDYQHVLHEQQASEDITKAEREAALLGIKR